MGLSNFTKEQDECRSSEIMANDFRSISQGFYPQEASRNVNVVAGESTSLTAFCAKPEPPWLITKDEPLWTQGACFLVFPDTSRASLPRIPITGPNVELRFLFYESGFWPALSNPMEVDDAHRRCRRTYGHVKQPGQSCP
jgi:hypothetical protein